MMLPSRNTGTPIQARTALATFDVSNCSGKVMWLKMISGMGTIRNKNAQGNRRARKKFHPKKSTIRLASTIKSDTRGRKMSAPNCPTMSTHIPDARKNKPHHEGCGFRRVSWDRSRQITNAEKKGTKKPWEKSGSFHHCATRWVSTGTYNQSNSPARTAICHSGGSSGPVAGARAVGGSDCSTWLTGQTQRLGG